MQATFFKNAAIETISNPIAIPKVQTVNIQFTPDAANGFTGVVIIDLAAVAQVKTPWYSIATIGMNPWISVATIQFSKQDRVINFNLFFDLPYKWIRARVTDTRFGSIAAYVAY